MAPTSWMGLNAPFAKVGAAKTCHASVTCSRDGTMTPLEHPAERAAQRVDGIPIPAFVATAAASAGGGTLAAALAAAAVASAFAATAAASTSGGAFAAALAAAAVASAGTTSRPSELPPTRISIAICLHPLLRLLHLVIMAITW
jgi:hypothetical protein